jgi:hypothetical protein
MVRLTGEYLGGILAGTGLGILLHSYFVLGKEEAFRRGGEWLLAAFLLIAIGSTLARYTQRKIKANDGPRTTDS